jgi:outer membrane receptor protein involved in Fe transport
MTRATALTETAMRTRCTVKLYVAGCGCMLSASAAWSQPAQQVPAPVMEEVVVTGSYIRRPTQADSPAPLSVSTQDDLDALGVNEVSDVIERLTLNTGSQNNPDAFTQNFTTGTSNINLRGLGVSSTLVMINGRRQTQSAAATDRGENFVDTSSLPPMIAFDRIETLKDGATALYGSEAVAGVVNFITRSNFEGFDLQLNMQTVDEHPQDDSQISGIYGVGNGTTHLLAAFSFLDRSALTTYDRRLSGPRDDISQAGNPGSFLVPSLPGNPAYAPVWTAAFDSNLNGVADALEPRRGLPPVPGAQLPVFADPNCAASVSRLSNVWPWPGCSVMVRILLDPGMRIVRPRP